MVPKNLVSQVFFFFFLDLGNENKFLSPNVMLLLDLGDKNQIFSPNVFCAQNVKFPAFFFLDLGDENKFLSPNVNLF
jgi:hypothetical protein